MTLDPTLDSFDLRDPDLYLDGPPHEIFAHLRREDPVHWSAESDGPGFWSVTRYRDLVAVSRDPATYSSARERGGHRLFDEVETSGRDAAASMISMDPPEHTRYRRMVQDAFGPARLDGLAGPIRSRTVELLDRLVGRRECELVGDVAAELPLQVLAELFGIPEDEREPLFKWSDAVIAEDDPEMRPSREHAMRCEAEMAAYALELWQRRLERPGDDLVTLLVHHRVDGRRISIERYLSAFALLLVAGNETTRNAIAAGVEALCRHPDQLALLVSRPEISRDAAEEILRWVSPVLHMRRTATRDAEIGGKRIRSGDKLALWYVSANRDEEVFERADEFLLERRAQSHVAFGVGPHFCLGARLASLELRIFLEEFLRRFPRPELAGPVRRVRSNFIHGIKELPLRLCG